MLQKKHTVSANDFSEVIYGKKSEQAFYEQILQELQEEKGNKRKGPQPISIHHVQQPHRAINRLTGSVDSPRFFYTEEFFLSSPSEGQTGLFCCVKCREELANDLKAIFYFLADTGIGGGASVGKGHIQAVDIVNDYLPYEEPQEETEHIVTLSLTFPDESLRRVLAKSWYVLEKRQGKVESMYTTPGPEGHVWKDHVLMLKEGSVFPQNGGQSYYGENRIVREGKHDLGFDVQQYGYAFTVNTNHITSVYQDEWSRQKL
jgi:CRISPR type III-A-associated RAMP protein Csm4